jgi:hypothetical protein
MKAQVSFSDRLLPVVRLSVYPSVCKLLQFPLLLQNHWADFHQTLHNFVQIFSKTSNTNSIKPGTYHPLGEENSSLFK